MSVNWSAMNSIRKVTEKGLMRGEEKQLSDSEVDKLNRLLSACQALMQKAEVIMDQGRQRFSTK
jgi:hypothetical protein